MRPFPDSTPDCAETEAYKWTPGPWQLSKRGFAHVAAGKDDRRGIASCGGYSTNTDDGKHITENEANAALCAAAPDLYDALAAIQWLCDDPNGSDQAETLAMGLVRLLPAARAALAKATGRTP